MEEGNFATNVELAEAEGLVRSETALSMLYLYHDLSEEARKQGYLSCLENLPAGYPDAQASLAERLTDKEFLSTLRGEYAMFYGAYAGDRSLLRFHYHRPDELWKKLSEVDGGKILSSRKTAFELISAGARSIIYSDKLQKLLYEIGEL